MKMRGFIVTEFYERDMNFEVPIVAFVLATGREDCKQVLRKKLTEIPRHELPRLILRNPDHWTIEPIGVVVDDFGCTPDRFAKIIQ